MEFESFAADERLSLAVVHAMQIVGEAANRLPGSLKRRYAEVPWEKMTGMRNFIVHGYYLVDLEIVWQTVRDDLPPMREAARRALADLESRQATSL